MTKYFIFEGEENCPCGRLKTYNECCRGRVDLYFDFWNKKGFSWLTPEFCRALAAVCGIAPRKGEIVPTAPKIYEALCRINDGLYNNKNPDERSLFVNGLFEKFMELINKKDLLKEIRLGFSRAVNLIERLDELLENNKGEKDHRKVQSEAIKKALKDWLDEEIVEEDNEDMVWEFFGALRAEEHTLEEREVLVYALKCFVDKEPSENPCWEAVLKASISDAISALEDIEEYCEPEDVDEVPILEKEVVERHPMLRRELSERAFSMAAPALDIILNGRLQFELPAYAVLGGLKACKDYLLELFAIGKYADINGQEFKKKLKELSLEDELYQALQEKAWNTDYEIFLKTVSEYLENWLQGEGKGEPGYIRSAVDFLRSCLSDFILDNTASLYMMVYIFSIYSVVMRKEASLPVRGDKEAHGIRWDEILTVEGMEEYSRYLEEKKQLAAAAHVRRVSKAL